MGKDFQNYVMKRVKTSTYKGSDDNVIKLDALFVPTITELENLVKESGYGSNSVTSSIQSIKTNLIDNIKKDFKSGEEGIKMEIEQAILASYLRRKAIDGDIQVNEAIKLVKDSSRYYSILEP